MFDNMSTESKTFPDKDSLVTELGKQLVSSFLFYFLWGARNKLEVHYLEHEVLKGHFLM